ncbi:helix-turn-helix transcriptional regulator [Leucobacter weissii]|uniref:Helix-turn-helix transcriptional regulator n=1 Tax=Leucobacter weissii TaxID=1983706 RepID=A0A939ML52_9MICO|nr:TetR family transcriptional regulator [Leucobacter weissii]MBO1902984.1 helix-turn-helix transcriptional regulator [Leucobacter weissii]
MKDRPRRTSGDPPRRGRPPSLTPEAIAVAVLEVGFPRLTFAAVRERLGVGETTLYRHAPDRDELVRLGLDHAMAQIDWPSLDGPWRRVMTDYAITAWHAWEAYPGSATEAARGIVPRGMMLLMDDLCAMLMRQGFSATNAVLACDVVFDLVTDNRRGVEHFDAIVPGAGPGRAHLHRLWEVESAPDAPGEGASPAERDLIHGAIHAAITAAPIDWFTGKLGVVLDGVERALAPR